MTATDVILDEIRALAESPGWSRARLAREAGLSFGAVAKIGGERWNPQLSTLRSLHTVAVTERQRLLVRANCEAPLTGSDCTFEATADRYLRLVAYPTKKTASQEEWILRSCVLPDWGDLAVERITHRHVVRLIDKLTRTRGPSVVERAWRTASMVFRFAIRRGLVDTDPCQFYRPPSKRPIRERVLLPTEIRILWERMAETRVNVPARYLILWQLVTAQRIHACRLATFSQIDRPQGVWIMPAENNKTGRAHIVPLSDLALGLLDAIEAHVGDHPYLFPTKLRRCPLDPITRSGVQQALRRLEIRFGLRHTTTHDLRRTAATTMISLGISRTVVQKVLGHKDPKTIAAYDQHDYEHEKRDALQAWGRWLEELIGHDSLGPALRGFE